MSEIQRAFVELRIERDQLKARIAELEKVCRFVLPRFVELFNYWRRHETTRHDQDFKEAENALRAAMKRKESTT